MRIGPGGAVHGHRGEGHLLPGLRAALRHGRDGHRRRLDRSSGPTPTTRSRRGFACPKGIAMTEVQNDPDRVLHPLRRRADGSSSGSAGTRRWTRSASGCGAIRDATAATSVGWYMGNPGAFSLLAPAVGQGLSRRGRLAALLHRLLAGRLQPLRRQRVPLRLAVHRPDPRPRADRFPARDRRQSAGLARQRPQRAADQGPAARDHRPRRPRRRRRPAPLGDGARLRAPADRPRRRRLDAALDARGDLRARGSRTEARSSARRAAARSCAGSRGEFPPEATEARSGVPARAVRALARDLAAADARRRLRAHRLLPRSQRHAGRASCSTR